MCTPTKGSRKTMEKIPNLVHTHVKKSWYKHKRCVTGVENKENEAATNIQCTKMYNIYQNVYNVLKCIQCIKMQNNASKC